MPDWRGAAVLDDLPDDIVVGKILILLPPKDIGRCRVVRKSWRTDTSTPEFMVEHRRRQPSLPVINGNGQPASIVALRAAVAARATSQQLWPFPSGYRKLWGCGIRLHSSSDGFLVVSRGARFYICNPTTRKHALLPFPRSSCFNDIYWLYQHKSTGEYRVLWSNVDEKEQEATLYVHIVGAKESRSIQVVLPTLPSPSQKQTYQLIYELSLPRMPQGPQPVHHCGSLHWLFRPKLIPGTGDIIVFDTEAESFRWMRNPPHDDRFFKWLFDMEGTLAFVERSTPDKTTMAVWVMKDYEAETWAFKYRIDLPMIEASRPLEPTSPKERRKRRLPLDSTARFFNAMTPLNERELLVGFNYKHVLRCDTDGKFLGMVTIGKRQYCMGLTGHRLQESIMPIPSGEMQGEDEEFPFSTEHV